MNLSFAVMIFVGSIVCGLGFTRRVSNPFELIRPRFVIPIAIFMATFAQPIVYWITGADSGNYARYREDTGVYAMAYIVACVMAFWAGFILPIGAALARPLVSAGGSVPVRFQSLRPVGYVICLIPFLLLVLIAGAAGLGVGTTGGILGNGQILTSVVGPIVHVLISLGAVCVGLSWPAKSERTFATVVCSSAALLLAASPYMASFSRGSGLTVLIAVFAYMLSQRKFAWLAFIFAMFWTASCSHAGLVGRGIYGHYAGAVPYLEVLCTRSFVSPIEVLQSTFGANDSFTPLCVTIKAIGLVDTNRLTPLQWIIFQVPLPRIFNIHPEWTFDITPLLGGQGTWNYTPGIFGDVYAHFEWFGLLVFVFIGMLFRFVDYLCIESDHTQAGRINVYVILLFTSYLAFVLALFNNFRSFFVAFMYPLYFVIALALLLKLFTQSPALAYEYIDQEAYDSVT